MHTSLIRVFFAVDLPTEQKEVLGKRMGALKKHLNPLMKPPSSFRWVRPESLHLTLQFLGEIKEEKIAGLLEREKQALEGLQAFQFNLGPLEWFPNSHRPTVLSLQATPQDALTKLAQALGDGALARGYVIEDRPFRPHITLARVENLNNPAPDILASFAWQELPPLFVKEVVLFRSDPGEGGPVYTRLETLKV